MSDSNGKSRKYLTSSELYDEVFRFLLSFHSFSI